MIQTVIVDGPLRRGQLTYDSSFRLTSSKAGVGTAAPVTQLARTYTPLGEVATETDANNNQTSYSYDGFGRLFTTTYPGGSYEQLSYDAAGNVVSRRLRDGQVLGYSYDALNRRTYEDNPNTNVAESDASYQYDLQGNLTHAGDQNGWYAGFDYDALGRVTRQHSNLSSNALRYDAAGRLIRQTWADGFFVTYEYDQTGAVTAVRENGGYVLASFGYNDLGRRTSLSRGNGTTTSYNYNAASRLATLTQDLAGGTHDVSATFGYNPAGQITSRTSSNNAYSFTGYHNVDRTYGVNGLNQLTNAGSTPLGYDARGNLTSSGSTTYGYNTRNQLFTNGAGHLFYRNPAGLLNHVIANGGVTNMDYVGPNLATEFNGNTGQIARRYVHGPGADAPLLWYEGSGTGDRRWLHADERGSIVAVTNGAGTATAINTYDEYGIPGVNNQGRFQYTGQKWIPELGMYDYKARMYSPTLGRFMQTDPIGYADGMNWYNYVGGDPVNGTDPSGLGCVGQHTNCNPNAVDNLPVDVTVTAQRWQPLEIIDSAKYSWMVGNTTTTLAPAPNQGVAAESQIAQDGSVLEQRGRRNGTGKRGEAGKNPNPDKHGPKKAFGKPGYVTDEGRDGQRGRPRPARPGEPGYGEGGLDFSAGDALMGVGVVVVVGGTAVLLAPEIAAALAAAGLVSLFAN